MDKLTEKTIRSTQLVDGKLLKVFSDDVRLPDGSEAVREWIDHAGASAVVPVFEDGSTVLVRQYRYASRRAFLEVPAGKLDAAGESPVDVAARELEEETGWKASYFTHLGSFFPCVGYSNEVIHFYLAQGIKTGVHAPDHDEHLEVATMPFDEAVAMALRGDILDMKTITALLLARSYLERQEESVKDNIPAS